MKRSSILERLYELNSEESVADKNQVTQLMYDVIHDKVSLKDAELKLRVIDPFYTRYEFLQNLKGKPIYKNIGEFRRGTLDEIGTMKMISSLVTQILIQKEHNPELNIKGLQFNLLLKMLKDYSEGVSVDTDLLNSILESYGWKDEGDSDDN